MATRGAPWAWGAMLLITALHATIVFTAMLAGRGPGGRAVLENILWATLAVSVLLMAWRTPERDAKVLPLIVALLVTSQLTQSGSGATGWVLGARLALTVVAWGVVWRAQRHATDHAARDAVTS